MSEPPQAPNIHGLVAQINTLGGMVRCADENGLFLNRSSVREAIYNDLKAADGALEAGKPNEAQSALVAADGKFNDAWHSANSWWRLCHAYGLWHNLGAIISGCLVAYLAWMAAPALSKILPEEVALFAVSGAVLRLLFYSSYQANKRVLRGVWVVRSLTGPVIAVILSFGTFIALKAGIILVTDVGVVADPNKYTIAFLALGTGLFWEEAMEKLKAGFAKARGSRSP